MQVDDAFFAGRTGWAEQVLYSVIVMERSNREFHHPAAIYKEQLAKTAYWEASDGEIRINIDFAIQQRLLMPAVSPAHRIYSYNPTRAIDAGIDRELVTEFRGMPVQADLMAGANLQTLEERTAYLLYGWDIYQAFVSEWNAFADLQENAWLQIYLKEGLIDPNQHEAGVTGTKTGAFSVLAERAGLIRDQFNYFPDPTTGAADQRLQQAAYIRDMNRANYEGLITQWLLDSGTTGRSGGVAISNDSYVLWMAERLQEITTSRAQLPTSSIDPRYLYRFAPPIFSAGSSDGDSAGPSGSADFGATDPANSQKSGLDLLEEIAGRENSLTSELGGGGSSDPINTLPEC
jgi:hypothetical protein